MNNNYVMPNGMIQRRIDIMQLFYRGFGISDITGYSRNFIK